MRIWFSAFILIFGSVNPSVLKAEAQEAVPAELDTGSHFRSDSPLGQVRVGVSRMDTDAEEGSISANLELGYIFEYETRDLVPWTLEFTPLYINPVDRRDGVINYQSGHGAGFEVTAKENPSPIQWFFRNTYVVYDELEERYHHDHPVAIEAMAGFKIVSTREADRARLDRIPRFITFTLELEKIDLSGFSDREIVKMEQFFMNAYFLRLIQNNRLFKSSFKVADDKLKLDLVSLMTKLGLNTDEFERRLFRKTNLNDTDIKLRRILLKKSLDKNLLNKPETDRRFPFTIVLKTTYEMKAINPRAQREHQAFYYPRMVKQLLKDLARGKSTSDSD